LGSASPTFCSRTGGWELPQSVWFDSKLHRRYLQELLQAFPGTFKPTHILSHEHLMFAGVSEANAKEYPRTVSCNEPRGRIPKGLASHYFSSFSLSTVWTFVLILYSVWQFGVRYQATKIPRAHHSQFLPSDNSRCGSHICSRSARRLQNPPAEQRFSLTKLIEDRHPEPANGGHGRRTSRGLSRQE
jgi:hypothetical protein